MAIDRSILQNSFLFGDLPEAELDRLVGQMRVSPVKKDQVLFEKDADSTGCYAVVEGAFKVVIHSSEGEETLLAVLGAGDIVGEMGLLDGGPRSATVMALRAGRVAYLSKRDFERVGDEFPSIYRHSLRLLSGRLRALNESLAARQMLPLPKRLARVFLRLGDEFGQGLDGGRVIIRQKFSQADLARMTGAARENVNRQIVAWQKENLISRVSSYYCLEDVDALQELGAL